MRQTYTAECTLCGNEIISKMPGRKFCSEPCRVENNRIVNREKYRGKIKLNPKWIKEEKECPVCEANFITKAPNQIYCSKECGQKLREFDFIHNNIEKAKTMISPMWLKARVFVFDRDSFTCKYCGRSPMSDSSVVLHVDHKLAKKHGGTDDLNNLITSCQECNLGKSDMLLTYWENEKKI